jgi:hypothetical protein
MICLEHEITDTPKYTDVKTRKGQRRRQTTNSKQPTPINQKQNKERPTPQKNNQRPQAKKT